jgi:Tetracyclin repressor-like, C-terminal domain
MLVRASVQTLASNLEFVTLLLRVRGNTEVERRALARRREFDRIVGALVSEAEAEGDIRPDVDPAITSRLLFGMINSLVEWYRPRGGLGPDKLADVVCTVAFEGLRRTD